MKAERLKKSIDVPHRGVDLLDKILACLGAVFDIEIYDDVAFGCL